MALRRKFCLVDGHVALVIPDDFAESIGAGPTESAYISLTEDGGLLVYCDDVDDVDGDVTIEPTATARQRSKSRSKRRGKK